MNAARLFTVLTRIALLCGVASAVLFLVGEEAHRSGVQLLKDGAMRMAPILGLLGILLGRYDRQERLAALLSVLAIVAVALSLMLSLWV